ncbi:putative photosystem II PsbY [Helianthus annuus]|uniref:Photosystem II PsbY n=2 Tax=Helianthus annuus TaxID=4232 RepID=A0A9K3GSE0_HELAN|nr:photosystem II core complex proteins psbY, chloroplastic [Helianthus annuus]KAF5754122.1 putative photosystem II PsbY [Helianthus annuus]KAJ0432065.1 putative photosystem II PsbY [Helianthus annuus]KAJ0824972.1 putative photosystem II PsbY [Helianthus annuus]
MDKTTTIFNTITLLFPLTSYIPISQLSPPLCHHNLHQPPMAATLSTTMAMLNAKCMTSSKLTKPISLPTIQTLTTSKQPTTLSFTGTTIAGAIFATLSSSDAAFAAQQLADIAEGDNRGIALLLPLVPAIAWVLYNIFQPAVNQINRMRTKGVVIGLGLGGGLAASSGLFATPDAAAGELAAVAEAAAASSDNRGQLLLIVIAPAILWVLYNILQPALNQINKMRS